MDTTLIIILACITLIHSTGEISAAPVEKVAKPNLSTEEIPEELPTKSVAIIGPQEKATPPVVVEETVPEATPLVEPVTILNENIPKETLPVKDDLVTLEGEDSLVYAEDTGYKAYNLSLQPLENDKTTGSLSAASLITALGLPATASFLQTLLTAYALPNGPELVEDILSKLLLVDDNLLVSVVQSLGKDALKNQGLTLEEFQAFLLDDDNESMSLLKRLITDAARGNNKINFQSKGLPYIKEFDDEPNFKATGQNLPLFVDSEDDPIIYTPNQEKTPTIKAVYEQSTQLNFNKLPPQTQSPQRQYPHQPYQDPNQNVNPLSAPSPKPSPAYYYSPPPNYQAQAPPRVQPVPLSPTYYSRGPPNSPNVFPGPQTTPSRPRFGESGFQGRYG